MSYQLKEKESTRKAIRRIVRKQIDGALAAMTSAQQDTDTAIHDARVCFKKIRAALRLVRKQLDGTFDKENVFYRDLGRRLSAIRNNAAMIESLNKLKKHFSGSVSGNVFIDLRGPFIRANSKQQAQKKRVLKEVANALRTARSRVKAWPLKKDDFADLEQGLRQTYRQGRAMFLTARAKPNVENLHEWRKTTKNLWYQVRILTPLWPDVLDKFAGEIEALADFLSDDHDLALVRQRIGDDSGNENTNELETLVALIDQRRTELQFQAIFLGGRIYAEKPRQFGGRFARYWKTWRSELRAQPKEINAAFVVKYPGRAA